MNKRLLSMALALLLAFQPTLLVTAQTQEQSVIEGDGYTIRSNVDGSKTVTFTAELEGSSGPADTSAAPRRLMSRLAVPETETEQAREEQLELEISGNGEDAQITMEYGGASLMFEPEIFEEKETEIVVPVDTDTGDDETLGTAGTATVPTEVHFAENRKNDDNADVPEISAPKMTAPETAALETSAPETAAPETAALETSAPETTAPETAALETSAPETTAPETATPETTAPETEAAETTVPETGTQETGLPETEQPGEVTEVPAETEGLTDTAEAGTETETDTEIQTELETEKAVVREIPSSEIRYRKLEDGVKEEMVMYGYRPQRRVEYTFFLGGLTPVREGNAFRLLDGKGKDLFTVSEPYMYDAEGNESRDIDVSMEDLGGGRYLLTYVPDDAWLSSEDREYPVVLDPTITITGGSHIEDNYTADGDESGKHFGYGNASLLAGNRDGINYTAFIRPALPESLKKISSNVIITSASAKINAGTVEGDGTGYGLYLVMGSWSSQSITGKNQPSLSEASYTTVSFKKGWNTFDIKNLVSEWFNCLDQKENCGFAIKAAKKKNNYIKIYSSDSPSSKDVEFSITYKEIPNSTDAGIKATACGNAANSGTGYVELSWNRVAGAESYYVGIFDGKEYEYFMVGNVTKYTTKGKGIWPTEQETKNGRYQLHGDGKGAELPCIPADSYGNVKNGSHGKDLKYYFCVVPCNEYGQAIDPGTFAPVSTVLPDRIAPNRPASVLTSPAGYTKQKKIKVSWNGVKDFTTSSASAVNSLGKGHIQFSIDSMEDWRNTTSSNASGTYEADISACEDGQHVIYIRGMDGDGNTGTPAGVKFYVDRTGPEVGEMSIQPDDWSNGDSAAVSWNGLLDLNAVSRVEYSIDGGHWNDTGNTESAYAGYEVDISGFADGEHTFALRAWDEIGNTGKSVTGTIRIDRTAPELGAVHLEPEGWSGTGEAFLFWTGMKDATSGIEKSAYAVDGEWTQIDDISENGSARIDVSALADGEHTVLLQAYDKAGNASDISETVLKRDTGGEGADPDSERAPSFRIIGPGRAGQALTPISCEINGAQPAAGIRWYIDGKEAGFLQDMYDARFTPEQGKSVLSGVYMGTDGKLYLSGANSRKLLDENTGYAEGTWESTDISCPEGTLAVKLEAHTAGGGAVYYCSTDEGRTWEQMADGGYAVFSQVAGTIRVKAEMEEGAALAGVRLYGYSASGYTVTASLSQKPTWVTASDYGAFADKRYELKWKDGQKDDTTASYTVLYRIYRNGELLTETEETSFTDTDYRSGASYEVSKVRIYEGEPTGGAAFTERESARTAAKTVVVKQEKKKGAANKLKETKQDDALSSLYSGNRTFSLKENPPSADRALNQSLLGKSGYCALGFEPVNFNTGNFLLEAQDYVWEGANGQSFDITRTYNAQSTDRDGLFGSKWASTCTQYLQEYSDGTVGYRKEDGALIVYSPSQEGYTANTAEGYTLEKTDTGYTVTSPECSVFRFSEEGVLKAIILNGQTIELVRNSRDTLCEVRLPGGKKILVETDRQGHITKLTRPGGAQMCYEYEDGNLVKMTDELGNSVRYVYDEKGRMTEWYDKAGNRQVYNKYDGQDRVIWQEDAKKSKYTLEYFDDHTVTTDAEGAASEIWFDAKMRTVKEVDAGGGETHYTYDAEGNLVGITDEEGRLTAYEYDSNGNQTGAILPDGTKALSEYDESGNLLSETDLNGNKTVYEYDGSGRIIKTTYADDAQEMLSYDENGNVASKTDANGNTVRYTYEGGRMTSKTDALGNVTRYEYDAEGNLVRETGADGSVNTYEYDGAGNCIKESYPDGTSRSYGYDALGNLLYETDPLGETISYEYDELSNCVTTTFADGSSEKREYSPNGNLLSETDCNGNVTQYTYDGNGNVLTETDALGNTTEFRYNAGGLMTEMILPDGGKVGYEYDRTTGLLIKCTDIDGEENTYEYDAEGNITANYRNGELVYRRIYDCRNRLAGQTYPDGSSESYEYDAGGNLIKFTDAFGNDTSYTYDGNNNLLLLTDALGNTTEYSYDCMENVSSKKDARGAVTEYTYDSVGNLIAEKDALGNVTRWEYDSNDQPVKETDAAGNVTRFRYDTDGNLLETVFADGGKESFSYDRNGNVLTETDPAGGTTTYVYDAAGNMVSMTDALGQNADMEYDAVGNHVRTKLPGIEEKSEYNAKGQLAAETDPTGTQTRYSYDEGGRLVSQSIEGKEISYEYDLMGNISKLTDPAGNTVDFYYDTYGRVVQADYPDGTSDWYDYDELGRLTLLEERDGSWTEYGYDECGNLTLEMTPEAVISYEYDLLGRMTAMNENGAVTTYAYDSTGNLSSETDAQGAVTKYEYNCMGDITAVENPDGSRTTAAYDTGGRMTRETDTAGNTVYYSYDALGHLTGVTDALGGRFSYAYNEQDEIVQVTDALGHSTYYTYDGAGNILSEKDALGNATEYVYTPEGWLKELREADGSVRTYTYDEVGNVVEEHLDGRLVRENTWDEMGNLLSSGNGKDRMEFDTDEAGNVTAVTYPDGRKVSYGYDEYGNLVSLGYPDGTAVSYEYDGCGRITGVTDADGKTTSYTYDLLGNLTGEKEDGLAIAYRYNSMGEIVRIEVSGTKELTIEYERDESGNITKETRSGRDGVHESRYTYDGLNRLTGFEAGNVSERYEYDAAGNMTEYSRCTDGVTTTVSSVYNEANQLIEQTDGEGTTLYSYNAKGDLVKKERNGKQAVYTYNDDGWLSSYTDFEGNRTELSYTPSGSLMEKRTVPADNTQERVTQYLYDVTASDCQILSETTDGNTADYIYGEGILRRCTEGASSRCIYDARGSIISEINGEDSVDHFYYPYGEVMEENSPQTSGETPDGKRADFHGYNGEGFHADPGMIYLRDRWYDPVQMRFFQKDLIHGTAEEPQSLNQYAYACDNPVSYGDPSGQFYFPTLRKKSTFSFGSPAKKSPVSFGGRLRRVSGTSAGRTGSSGSTKSAYRRTTRASSKKSTGASKTSVKPRFTRVALAGSRIKRASSGRTTIRKSVSGPKYGGGNGRSFSTAKNSPKKSRKASSGKKGTKRTISLSGKIRRGELRHEQLNKALGKRKRLYQKTSTKNGKTTRTVTYAQYKNGRVQVTKNRYVCTAAKKPEKKPGPLKRAVVYIGKSFNQVIKGNYTDDVTALGTALQIGASFTGLDGIADTRDIVYDVTHFEKTPEHVIQTIADGIAFLPVIGAGKYADETVGVIKKTGKAADTADAVKDAAKYGDEVADAAKAAAKTGKTSKNISKVIEKKGNLGVKKLAKSVPSSRVLKKNLIKAGIKAPTKYSYAAHHIVAGRAHGAKEARDILDKFGIDINDAANGVFLPTKKGVTKALYHPGLHTTKYYKTVNNLLSKAKNAEDAKRILKFIADSLSDGTFLK